jgi:biopolymer transport protein ExbD
MKENRRMKRMSRGGKGVTSAGLNLVSLMDVFTILVFFLLVNSSSSDVMEPPKNIKLPDSVVEAKPRETVIVMITPTEVLVQGEPVIYHPGSDR